MNTVEFKDRIKEIDHLRIALDMVEIGVDYPTTDLIIRIRKEATKLGDSFSIDDAAHIQANWRNEWDEYFENQKRQIKP